MRDKIPDIIIESGGEYEARIMGEVEFAKELKKKLVEETKELIDSPDDKLSNELADVLELVKSIASLYKIPFPKIERSQEEKRIKRGGFKKKLFLIWSTQPAGK